MSLRETCLTHAIAAAALLSLHVVEARAGQNEAETVRRRAARPPGTCAAEGLSLVDLGLSDLLGNVLEWTVALLRGRRL